MQTYLANDYIYHLYRILEKTISPPMHHFLQADWRCTATQLITSYQLIGDIQPPNTPFLSADWGYTAHNTSIPVS